MSTDYLDNIAAKKKVIKRAGLLVIFMLIIFIFALYKFAQNSDLGFIGTGFPGNEDAYIVAKVFIKGNVRADAQFPTDYKVAHKKDSSFIIRTVVSFPEGERTKTNTLKVYLRYKGGKQDDANNWLLLNIEQEN